MNNMDCMGEEEVSIKELRKLRPTMTIPQLSNHFGVGARRLEELLSKHKIRKHNKHNKKK